MGNGIDRAEASNRVVDFENYKRQQVQRRLNFESTPPSPEPPLARVAQFRPLTERAVRHRQLMIRHLSGRS